MYLYNYMAITEIPNKMIMIAAEYHIVAARISEEQSQ